MQDASSHHKTDRPVQPRSTSARNATPPSHPAGRAAVESVGGTFDCFYYAFGDTDIVGIIDVPDEATAFNASLLINSSGAVSVTLTPLYDPSVIGAGAAGTYTPPGQ